MVIPRGQSPENIYIYLMEAVPEIAGQFLILAFERKKL